MNILKVKELVHDETGYYTKLNRLNPLTWGCFFLLLVTTPFFCMFTNTTLQEQYGDLYKGVFKGRL